MHLLQNVINKRFPMYTKTPMRYKVSCHFLMDNSKKFDESCYKTRKFGNDFLFVINRKCTKYLNVSSIDNYYFSKLSSQQFYEGQVVRRIY